MKEKNKKSTRKIWGISIRRLKSNLMPSRVFSKNVNPKYEIWLKNCTRLARKWQILWSRRIEKWKNQPSRRNSWPPTTSGRSIWWENKSSTWPTWANCFPKSLLMWVILVSKSSLKIVFLSNKHLLPIYKLPQKAALISSSCCRLRYKCLKRVTAMIWFFERLLNCYKYAFLPT